MNVSERIKQIALSITPDYPDIADDSKSDDFARLWAIEQCYEGASAAIYDWYLLVKVLCKKFGMSKEECQDLFHKVFDAKMFDRMSDQQIIEKFSV